MSDVKEGTVKWFNEKKGYGFISCEGDDDLFVHFNDIETDGFKTLSDGQKVEFTVGEGQKGPTAKNLRELGHPVSATTVANYYRDFLDGFVVDTRDKATVPEIEKLGLSVEVTDTLMTDLASKAALAKTVLAFAQRCRAKR